jgi:radical SAM superfamily enzyme YgiQ (UPF0313 family)
MIALVNPKSARWSFRFPLSIMHIGAELEGRYPYEIFDHNIDPSAEDLIGQRAANGTLKYLALTVMPGPQLAQAIPLTKRMRERFPHLKIIWGGYFATLHATTVLTSGLVDYVIRGPGEKAFPELIDFLEGNARRYPDDIHGVSFRRDGEVVHNEQRAPTPPDAWPPLPFHKIRPERYLNRTYLGRKTAAYYSSAGCPFLCGFCAIASIYQARWVARSPALIARDILDLKENYGVDAIEFFDENFFTSEKRVAEFSALMIDKGISWWGEGRPDTVLAYSDETLRLMRRAGCTMIFFGAESSSEETLFKMHKGGTQTPGTVLQLAERLRKFSITPEFSFVLGGPGKDIDADIERDIRFIRRVKAINPRSEIILYIYAPVVFEDSELSRLAKEHGFRFPTTLEEWMRPEWQRFDMRKTPVIPWMKSRHFDKIRNFERVLNGRYPTVTDVKLTSIRMAMLRAVSGWRYNLSVYAFPIEIRLLLKLFRYRQPELEGF